jgi:hypothetical protein
MVIADIIYVKNTIYWIFAAFSTMMPIIFLVECDYFYFGKIENWFFSIFYSAMIVLLYVIPFFLMHYFVRKKIGQHAKPENRTQSRQDSLSEQRTPKGLLPPEKMSGGSGFLLML